MIGGRILEIRNEGERTRLWCVETTSTSELAIYVRTQAEMPALGDDIWWQERKALWTPKDRRFRDRVLERIGYSFDPTHEEPASVAAPRRHQE